MTPHHWHRKKRLKFQNRNHPRKSLLNRSLLLSKRLQFPKSIQQPSRNPPPEPTPKLAQAQTVIEPQSGDMVYVEGYSRIESQGPSCVEYAMDMYESGNKIGIMD